ncbi:MAG: hypothetical protein QXD43_04845 [Candidatus Aenigmatarchaeota archaeon]
MKTKELLLNAVNQPHERTYGRYYASELYQIIKGYLKPKDFFKTKEIDLAGAENICRGEAYEAKWKEILEINKIPFKYGDEIKREIKIKDFILVVKPDFEFNDWVLETKYPVRSIKEIPEKWIYQLEAEYQATHKKVYLGIFEPTFKIKYFLYHPNSARWDLIIKTLEKFHSEISQILKK